MTQKHESLADGLRRVEEALTKLAPFEFVQGDAIHRTNPGSHQVVNSNQAWAASSQSLRSGHAVKRAIDEVHEAIALIPSLIARAEELEVTPAGDAIEAGRLAICIGLSVNPVTHSYIYLAQACLSAAYPALVAEVERLRKENEELHKGAERNCTEFDE